MVKFAGGGYPINSVTPSSFYISASIHQEQIYILTRTQVWNILGWLKFTVFNHDKYVVASEAVTIVLAREVKLSG